MHMPPAKYALHSATMAKTEIQIWLKMCNNNILMKVTVLIIVLHFIVASIEWWMQKGSVCFFLQ